MNLKPTISRWWPLFLVSGLGLFFELAVIRWISAEVRLFSYFKNLPLLAAFLGLAIGFAVAGKGRDYRSAFAPLLTVFVAVVIAVGRVVSPRALAYPSSGDEFIWFAAPFSYWLSLTLFLAVVLIFFLLTMFLFVPLGQVTGEEMAQHAPVPAYIVNILASLVGVWVFSFLSYLQVPPAIWFGLGLVGFGAYLAVRRVFSRLDLLLFVLVLAGLTISGQGIVWSPYQRLEIVDLFLPSAKDGRLIKVGYTLKVQQVFHQTAIDLSHRFLTQLNGELPDMEDQAFAYDLPYGFHSEGTQVLIVGAGMGNDAAAALRNRAAHVDAVEIDPVILELGRKLHPEHPYNDPHVTAVVDDARSFFKKSSGRYDVVAFGFLDSQTLLSGMSSVRLDSFVYTSESFRQVKEHLTQDGITVVSFAVGAPWIQERLGRMLIQAFGPDLVFIHPRTVGTTFVAGPLSPGQLTQAQLVAWRPDPAFDDMPLATDDWPYLYLRARQVPAAYWQALLLIGLVCLVLIARSFPEAMRPNWHFWLLGAAFLLVEFKSTTEFALLFGTTWLVNALAISGVLLMALAANVIVLCGLRPNVRLAYGFLFASLALTYFFPLDALVGLAPAIRAVASMVLLSLPLFFAGLIFSESLRQAGEAAGPLASNLSGSVAGGILEYGSLWWGIKSLYVIAAVVYLGALLASRWRSK